MRVHQLATSNSISLYGDRQVLLSLSPGLGTPRRTRTYTLESAEGEILVESNFSTSKASMGPKLTHLYPAWRFWIRVSCRIWNLRELPSPVHLRLAWCQSDIRGMELRSIRLL